MAWTHTSRLQGKGYCISRDKANVGNRGMGCQEDHDNSIKAESVRELITQAVPLLDGMPEKGQELEVIGGADIRS